MNYKLTDIDPKEVLAALGHPGAKGNDAIMAEIEWAKALLFSTCAPRAVYARHPVQVSQEKVSISDANITLAGRDLARHLSGCTSAYVMAATLGAGVDHTVRRLQVEDMAKAVVFHAAASAGIEQLCNMLSDSFAQKTQAAGEFITSRFSPGYGDMPINTQADILTLLDAPKKIGLSHTAHFLLTPTKSVTALVGISNKPPKTAENGCSICPIYPHCEKRKAGNFCGTF